MRLSSVSGLSRCLRIWGTPARRRRTATTFCASLATLSKYRIRTPIIHSGSLLDLHSLLLLSSVS